MTSPEQTTSSDPAPTVPAARKAGLAKALRRLALSVLLLVVIEVVLRLVGFGGHVPVLNDFATRDGVTYARVDHEGIARFFDTGGAGSIRSDVVATPKPPDTVRVFLLGDSAAYGYPHGRHLCAAAFLEAMLADAWPDKTIDIVNLGATGVASFPVVCMAEEALEHDADLLIVWTGTNEFYGTYGVASSQGVAQSTTLMRARHAATGLGIVDAVWTGMVRLRSGSAPPRGTLMDQMVGVASVAPDDGRRETAARNLERHLRHIAERGARRGVPVIVCTPPANERDMAPIGVVESNPLTGDERATFEAHLARGRELVEADPKAALARLDAARAMYGEHALVEHLRGRCLLALGDRDAAIKALRLARDLDPMPWRAPSRTNDAIRRAGAGPGAILRDMEAAFRAATPDGLVGWELLVDQVHPNLSGQYLVARTMLAAMGELDGPLRIDPAFVAALPPAEVYFGRLGANPFDEYVALDAVAKLFESRLFQATRDASLAHTRASQQALTRGMQPWQFETMSRWLRESGDSPEMPVTAALAMTALEQGRQDQASRLFEMAHRAVGDASALYMRYGWRALYARAQVDPNQGPEQMAIARRMIAAGERLLIVGDETDHQGVAANLGLAYKYVGDDAKAIDHLEPVISQLQGANDLLILNALVDSLVKTGQIERARTVLRTDLPHPELKAACTRWLAQLEGR